MKIQISIVLMFTSSFLSCAPILSQQTRYQAWNSNAKSVSADSQVTTIAEPKIEEPLPPDSSYIPPSDTSAQQQTESSTEENKADALLPPLPVEPAEKSDALVPSTSSTPTPKK